MAFVNLQTGELHCKLAYHGPRLSGKTTNFERIYDEIHPSGRSEVRALQEALTRARCFDFIPRGLGELRGLRVRLHVYTAVGNLYQNKGVEESLRGVDGLIFIADSQAERVDANIESLERLRGGLMREGRTIDEVPHVIQYNKRDAKSAVEVGVLERILNPQGQPYFATIAAEGIGVRDTFKSCVRQMLLKLKRHGVSP